MEKYGSWKLQSKLDTLILSIKTYKKHNKIFVNIVPISNLLILLKQVSLSENAVRVCNLLKIAVNLL